MAQLKAARYVGFFFRAYVAHRRNQKNNLIKAKAFVCIQHKRNSSDWSKLELSHCEDADQEKVKLAPVGTNFTCIICQDVFKNQ